MRFSRSKVDKLSGDDSRRQLSIERFNSCLKMHFRWTVPITDAMRCLSQCKKYYRYCVLSRLCRHTPTTVLLAVVLVRSALIWIECMQKTYRMSRSPLNLSSQTDDKYIRQRIAIFVTDVNQFSVHWLRIEIYGCFDGKYIKNWLKKVWFLLMDSHLIFIGLCLQKRRVG